MNEEELAYYRAVEDHFALARGTPFLLSPKDFGLLRGWWQDDVPLAAILVGVSEVADRRRLRGEGPVSSLSYCRHAVMRHAKRLREASAGGRRRAGEPDSVEVAAALTRTVREVLDAADRWHHEPAVASALSSLADAIGGIPVETPAAVVDETLARLETGFLTSAAGLLSASGASDVEREIERLLAGLDAEAEVVERTRRALRIRVVRQLLGLSRLEIAEG